MRRRGKPTGWDFESRKEELARISDELTSLRNSLGETTSAETRAKIDRIRGGLNNITSETGRLASAGVTTVQETVEENLIVSVAVALGSGVLLGSVLRR
jgi:ElaB/YqjD/DUF883 family membrane-anchored ribosome-binding protein